MCISYWLLQKNWNECNSAVEHTHTHPTPHIIPYTQIHKRIAHRRDAFPLNHSLPLKSNYRNMNNAFNFEFVQLEVILCYVWCVCRELHTVFYLQSRIRSLAFFLSHSFNVSLSNCTKDYKVCCHLYTYIWNIFGHVYSFYRFNSHSISISVNLCMSCVCEQAVDSSNTPIFSL